MPKETQEKVSYKDTLNLPQTDFPIRPNPKEDDPKLLHRWKEEDLYQKSFYAHKGSEKYVLHDGPPYANGNIHIGHAYNKILKDFIGKSQRMMGKQVPITPGWDCHGLPIELKVTQQNPNLSPNELRKKCREYAQHWINVQRDEFEALGVLMNWQHPYLTMNFSYEADILRAFGMFVEDGYIQRKNKTVPWCASCQTVLASAEIEYQERKDPSIYVLFPIEEKSAQHLFPTLQDKKMSFVVWTTTPWTLPLNRALLIHPDAEYVVLAINEKYVIIGEKLADALCNLLDVEKNVIARTSGKQILDAHTQVHHPFVTDLIVPVIGSATVGTDEGTAVVHCAPGCGPEDYEIGVRNKLEIFSPVSADGSYTKGIEPRELEGMKVSDGQIWVIKELAARDAMLYKTSLRHSYPHCWRCRNGLIFRATKQWFCDLAQHNLKDRALDAIASNITSLPESSANRLKSTVEGRLEWCLSRQRIWGVPIPALLCTGCDDTYISKELIDTVAQHVEKEGIEWWQDVALKDLVPTDFACKSCKGTAFKKEQDILDVWFDSGVSHYAVLYKNPELAFPANSYVEGKDQHRGWFQSSLLTGLVIEKQPPMKMILTHGFCVDEKGRKMSKSIGNVVSPQDMIEKLGTDGLRLWVSSIDYANDAVVSAILLDNVKEVFRKVRNTARFLLSNLYDFDNNIDTVPFDQLQSIDQYALYELNAFNDKMIAAYASYDFTAIFHGLGDYASVQLSSFYLDIIKDRLYVEQADGHLRRSAQTVCWQILDTLTRIMAPVLSFTAEQLSDLYQKDKKESIHLQSFAPLDDVKKHFAKKFATDTEQQDYQKLWVQLKEVRSAILKAIETLREQGTIKHPLEGHLTVYIAPDNQNAVRIKEFFDSLASHTYQNSERFLKEYAIVSQVTRASSDQGLSKTDVPGLWLKVTRAEGEKCPRCWQYDTANNPNNLCDRCYAIVGDK